MKSPLRFAPFRTLAPDEKSGGAFANLTSVAPEASDPIDFEHLADAAYDAVEHEPDEETASREEPETGSDTDEFRPDAVGMGNDLASLPAGMVESGIRSLDARLTNPATAAGTLRDFVQAVAAHHGVDLASMLGHIAPGAASHGDENYATPGERRLAQRLDALQARVEPTVQAQQSAIRNAHYDDLVRHMAPATIDSVKSDTGWTPTAEQVLQAARTYPQLAASSLSHAVQAAYVKEIVAAARDRAKPDRSRLDDMPVGGPRSGTRAYEPSSDGSVDWNKLAEAAYEAVVAG